MELFFRLQHGANPTGRDSALWWMDVLPDCLLMKMTFRNFLNRRKPGQSKFTTPRKEDDAVEILSGVFEGKTTGTPISLVVYNQNQKSKDYSEIASYYRPGHADYTFDQKYGFRDYRGGGRSSGRETIGRVAAGAIAVKILNQLGITFLTYTRSIGPISISSQNFDAAQINENPLYMPDADAAENAENYLNACIAEQNSSGGVVECIIQGANWRKSNWKLIYVLRVKSCPEL